MSNIIERVVVKTALSVFKISPGVSGYIVTPIINELIRNGKLIYDTKKGEIIADKILKSKKAKKYNAAIDSIFD